MDTEVVQGKYDENQVPDKDDNDNQSQELTEPPDVTRSTEKENEEKGEKDKNVLGILAHVKVMELAKDQKGDGGEERDGATVEQEVQKFTKVKTTQQMKTDQPRSEESDTPVEENEEVMWPEGGVLLTFVEKASQKQKEKIAMEIQVKTAIGEPEGGMVSSMLRSTAHDKVNKTLLKPQLEDMSTPKEDCENSEKLQKSWIDSVVPTLLTNQHTAENIEALMEEMMDENIFKLNMQEKLIKPQMN